MFQDAAAMQLGERANDAEKTHQKGQSHTSFPAWNVHCPNK